MPAAVPNGHSAAAAAAPAAEGGGGEKGKKKKSKKKKAASSSGGGGGNGTGSPGGSAASPTGGTGSGGEVSSGTRVATTYEYDPARGMFDEVRVVLFSSGCDRLLSFVRVCCSNPMTYIHTHLHTYAVGDDGGGP